MATKHKKTACKDLFYKKTEDNDILYYILKPKRGATEDIERIIGKKSDGITEKEICEKWLKKIRPSERYATNKIGVFWRHCKSNGKDDKTFYITYKILDEKNPTKKKTIESVVGKFSQGIREVYAYKIYTDTITKVNTGDTVPIKRRKKQIYTFANAFDKYISHVKNNGKKTWKKDKELYTNHLKDFHSYELVGLTKTDFEELKTEKLKTHSKRTVQYILAVARQIINHAIEFPADNKIKRFLNPLANGKVKVTDIDNDNEAYFTYEQADVLLKELAPYKNTSLIYQLTVILLHTGARFSEVASLTWNNIDMEKNTIHFKATKGGNKRDISMSALLQKVIKELPQDNLLVFHSQTGNQIMQMPDKWQMIVDTLFQDNKITLNRVKKQERKKDEKYKIELRELSNEERELLNEQKKSRLTVHSLRHTHASWMAISGNFNILEIRDELGHKTTKMTERYAHLMPQDRHKKTNALFDGL